MFEGRWVVMDTVKKGGRYHYIIKNIYNNEKMVINPNMMTKIANNKTTVSKVRCIRLKREKLPNDGGWEFAGRRR